MNGDLETRLQAYRTKLFAAIQRRLEEDGHCMHYEGSVTVKRYCPNYFEREQPDVWEICLDCYVLGPTRHYAYEGATLAEALAKAEADLDSGIAIECE